MSRITRRTIIPVNQITPLTYRDGVTYIQLLTELSEYIKSILHPSLQHTVDQLVADVEAQMDKHHDQYVDGVQQFQRIHDAFMSDVNAKLIALNDGAVSDLVKDDASYLSSTLRELFLEKTDTDAVVADHMRNENSETRTVVDTLLNNLDIGDELRSEFNDLSTDIRSQVETVVDENTAYQTGLNQALDQALDQLTQIVDGKGNITSEYHDKGARVVYGTLRNQADGTWYLLEDSAHITDAIESIVTTDTGVEIITKPPKSGSIAGGTIIAVTDETLAKNGFSVGGSGGGRRTVLQFGRSKSISDRVWFEKGEFKTLYNNFQVSEVDGTITLNHETMYGQTNVSVSPWPRGGGAIYIPVVMAASETRTVVRLYSLNGNQASSFTENTRFFITRSDDNTRTIDPHTIGHVGSGNVWFLLVQPYK